MGEIDCLFIHPATHCKAKDTPASDLVTFMIMPLGTMALADLLQRNGYSTKIFHTGIEQKIDRGFQVESLFSEFDPSVVGIDLHWFVHSYDAIRIAEIAKRSSNAMVVLGGFTATYFAKEIMERFDCVDAVITGDAEKPLLELMRNRKPGLLDVVPNLWYREGGSIKHSDKIYTAGEEDLATLEYSNFDLLSNSDRYFELVSQAGDLDPQSWRASVKRHAWLPIGRGCNVGCSYCGGGQEPQRLLAGRVRPIFHPLDQVIRTLREFEERGIDSVYMDFDPQRDRRYHRELFGEIRNEKIDISAEFLLWSPSDSDFVRDFHRTFNPTYSVMALSPESGSEEVRRRNKGVYYDDVELFAWLESVKRELVPAEIYFASGLSWETPENFHETIGLAKRILDDYPVVNMGCNPLVMEPACPRFLHPDRYGVKLKFKAFLDYYERFESLARGLPSKTQLGYDTIWETENQIIENSVLFNKTVTAEPPRRWEALRKGEEPLRFRI